MLVIINNILSGFYSCNFIRIFRAKVIPSVLIIFRLSHFYCARVSAQPYESLSAGSRIHVSTTRQFFNCIPFFLFLFSSVPLPKATCLSAENRGCKSYAEDTIMVSFTENARCSRWNIRETQTNFLT